MTSLHNTSLSKSFNFHPIPQSESSSRPFTPSDTYSLDDEYPSKRSKQPYYLVVIAAFILFIVITISFWVGRKWDSLLLTSSYSPETITRYCSLPFPLPNTMLTTKAPLLEEIPLHYTPTRFNGSLLKPTIYRGDASPLVDSAWEALGVNYRSISVPQNLARKSGIASDQVKISPAYGGGYPANLEGLHHLHCLNLLRQSLYYNYDYYSSRGQGAFANEPYILKKHVSHCLDILRQQLMCTVDIGVMGQVWIHPEAPEPYVDFNSVHMCRNFEAVRKWAEERQLPFSEELPDDWLERPRKGDRVYEEMP